jgi:small subunit ribosomal protein S16
VIKLRLRRMGAKKQPNYRIVAAESSKPRDGRFIEIIGHYDPKTDPYTLRVDEDRAKYWLEHGAQPTETVRALLVKSGVLPPYQGPPTKSASSKSKATKAEAEEPSAEPEAEAEPETSSDDEEAEAAEPEEATEASEPADEEQS